MSDLEKLLGKVAEDIYASIYWTDGPTNEDEQKDFNDIHAALSRLLPLLEAGQAMRDSILFCPVQPEAAAWDAALEKAKGK